MPLVERVLDREPVARLADYLDRGGGRAIAAARRLGPLGVIDEVEAAGLRGRGGAGFPTGVKWRTVAAARSSIDPTPVVVNGAEGEPGTFKDRALLRANPYRVIEGAIIAALAIDASEVILCLKASFTREIARARAAMAEIDAAGWAPGLTLRVVEGPGSYLFGEETALLEVIDGRQPFPRVTPPYRRGLGPPRTEAGHSASDVHLAAPGGTDEAPALVDNVETMANVPGIVAEGADWYRAMGTPASPGTLVCTVSGALTRHGVGEVPMGTPLREAFELIGGPPARGRRLVAAMSGVANAVLPEHLLDTPLSYEAMADVGSGLGAGGFIAFDDATDMVAVAAGVARFLAVESCGQCEPCKRDGLALASHLRALSASDATDQDVESLSTRLATVADGARCFLASQQERVIRSVLRWYPDAVAAHAGGGLAGVEPEPIVPIADIVDGRVVLDLSELNKQPDWSYDEIDSGAWPAAKLGNEAVSIDEPHVRERMGANDAAVANRAAGPDPLQPLLDLHRGLREALDEVVNADPPDRPPAIGRLRQKFELETDVTQRVVYPMARRVATAAGDDATWAAEHDEASAAALLERIEGASTVSDDDALRLLVEEIREVVDDDEQRVVPLLRANLDEVDLTELGDAIQEACATSRA